MLKHKKNQNTLMYTYRENTGKIKTNFFKREFKAASSILQYQGKSEYFNKLKQQALILSAVGVLIGLVASNLLLGIFLAIGLGLIPIWKVRISEHKFKTFVADELESGLSMITTTYLRHNNFINAVKENIEYLNEPLKNVMERFITETEAVNPSVTSALIHIKPLIKNNIWTEWVNELIKCQTNHILKVNLIDIVNKLSDVKIMQSELNVIAYKKIAQFKMILLIDLLAIPVIYLMNKEWFYMFFNRLPGKISLVAVAALLIFCVVKVIRLSSPIEYKR